MVNRLIVALLAATVVLQLVLLLRQRPSAAPPQPSAVEDLGDDGIVVSLGQRPRLGDFRSRIVMIEISDFECPFCLRYFKDTFAHLKKEYVDTGLVSYVYMHLPLVQLHPNAMDAAKAAQCAGEQDRFWQAHDGLFEAAAQHNLNSATIGAVVRHSVSDVPTFDDCLLRIEARVARDVADAATLGVRSTPVFLLGVVGDNGTAAIRTRINGAHPLGVFKEAIDALQASALASRVLNGKRPRGLPSMLSANAAGAALARFVD